MSPLDKLIQSIDPQLVKDLRRPVEGHTPMEAVALGPLQMKPEHFIVDNALRDKLIYEWDQCCVNHQKRSIGQKNNYQPWTMEEKTFAAAAAMAFFEALQGVQSAREMADYKNTRFNPTKASIMADASESLFTSTVSRNILNHLVEKGLKITDPATNKDTIKRYTEQQAVGFLGVIAHGVITAYPKVLRLKAEIHPQYDKKQPLLIYVDSVQMAPINNSRMIATILRDMEQGGGIGA